MTAEDSSRVPATPVLRFRARHARAWSVAAWVFALVGVAWTVWEGQPWAMIPWVLVGWLGWWLLWRPDVVLHPEHVVIANPWATHQIPLAAINDVTSEYHLTVQVGLRKIQAWAAPNDAIGATRVEYVRNSIHAMRTFTTLPKVETFTGHEGHTHGVRATLLQRRDALARLDAQPEPGRQSEPPSSLPETSGQAETPSSLPETPTGQGVSPGSLPETPTGQGVSTRWHPAQLLVTTALVIAAVVTVTR